MTGFKLVMLCNAAFLVALLLTGLLRRYAIHAQLIDHAEARSAHASPTPRGGGASIVLVTLIGLVAAHWLVGLPLYQMQGLVGGGAIVALIGWLDDHGHVRPIIRLAVHFVGAAWLVWWVGPFPFHHVSFWNADWDVAARLVSALFVVWMINLYNFMDGIDGLASGEAIAVTIGGALLLLAAGAATPATLVAPLLLAATTLGFLPWNWPPAQIFMGDASSGFLGFMLAALVLVMGTVQPQLAFAWTILPGVFIADTTVTIIRRLLRGERIYEAHSTHAYQHWARQLGGHLPVTVVALTTTWLWLFPVAYLIANKTIGALPGAVVAIVPLFSVTLMLGSGKRNQ